MKSKTILITGAYGQLSNKLIEMLSKKHKLILTDYDTMDITNASEIAARVSKEKPNFIIHAAAYTKVDQAEEEKDLCHRINSLGTKNVAEAAKKNGTVVIYISTDFVFADGKGKPLTENDKPEPLSVYGQTKLEGENFIKDICDKYYIIRAAWLFGELPKDHPGSNFVETMLRLAHERNSLCVVNDQIGSPTYTGDLVRFIDFIIDNKPKTGIYHFSGEGEASWYDFAKEIFKQTKNKIDLEPITSAEYPSKAKRPAYSYLSKEKIKSLGFKVRPWQEMLSEYLQKRG